MKITIFLAATLWAMLSATPWAMPVLAQSISAPDGWRVQKRDGGATTFTPPDLRAGEKYSVTVYPPAPLKGQTPAAYLRAFAGPVGSKTGQLVTPLRDLKTDGDVTVAQGTYRGPNGMPLRAAFFGVAPGDGNITVERILFSGAAELLNRYQNQSGEIMQSLVAGARRAAGVKPVEPVLVPEAIFDTMKRGGAFVPGIYAGTQKQPGGASPLRVHLYANGEWRITGPDDKQGRSGEYSYEARSGKLNIDWVGAMWNRISPFGNTFCFFGRDAAGKPFIYADKDDTVTTLRLVGPPTKRPSPRAETARYAAIQAEAERYKFVVAPGKGLKAAQIAAVWWDQVVNSDGMNISTTNKAYLLLRDGTIRRELPVAFDEMDILKSRQKEPEKWGKWRRKAGKTQVSWQGAPFVTLKGVPAVPGAAGTRVKGHYGGASSSYFGTGSSYSFWGVAFDPKGRFSKDSSSSSGSTLGVGDNSVTVQSGSNNGESYAGAFGGGVAVGSVRKKNPNGDREGTYAINGYTITLRYDNGKIERLPFFFNGARRDQVWFEGGLLAKDSK